MTVSWKGRDYRFSFLISLGLLISLLIIPPLAPPTVELIIWAPVGGILLTLGMARLQRRGTLALMMLPLVVLFIIIALIGPRLFGLFAFYLAIAAFLAEAVVFWFENYHIKRNRFLGNLVFFTSGFVVGVISAALTVGNDFAELLRQHLQFAGLTVAAALSGSIGWWVGELLLSKLKQSGKWKQMNSSLNNDSGSA